MSKMNSVVHFEIPYEGRERMATFYRTAFGWQTKMLGEEMGNYVLATTTETDETGPQNQARSMAVSSRSNRTGRRSTPRSSSQSMTFKRR